MLRKAYYYYLITGLFIVGLSGLLLYMLLAGGDTWKRFRPDVTLASIHPYQFASLGLFMSNALCVSGAAWGMFIVGTTIMGAGVKAPHVRVKNMIGVIFCEASATYGLIVTMILQENLQVIDSARFRPDAINCTTDASFVDAHPDYNLIPASDCLYTVQVMSVGYVTFFAGAVVGFCNLVTGIAVGITGAGCCLVDARNPSLFSKILLISIFASVLGLFGLVVSLLMGTKLGKMP